jgi:hypothetical protein
MNHFTLRRLQLLSLGAGLAWPIVNHRIILNPLLVSYSLRFWRVILWYVIVRCVGGYLLKAYSLLRHCASTSSHERGWHLII